MILSNENERWLRGFRTRIFDAHYSWGAAAVAAIPYPAAAAATLLLLLLLCCWGLMLLLLRPHATVAAVATDKLAC
jgi:hypothetical protein